MTNQTAVTKVTDLFCEGNHPDGPMHAASHFHDGPAVCGTHYARMRKAEMAAKKGQEKAAVEAAMKEPAPTKNGATKATSYTVAGLDVPEMVGIWLETAAKIRKMETKDLLIEIATEYYNQTCPEYLRKENESRANH